MESFCKKIYRSFLKFRKPLNFYKIKVENFKVDKTLTGVRFHQIVDYTDLVDFFRSVNYKLERYHYKRMMNNDVFYYLAFDDKIVCYGWSTKKALFVSEISRVLKIDNGVILYDFFTDPSFRNRGYYQYLLKKIIEKSDYGLFAYIYALTTNLASNKAILKAGFKKVKTKKLF
jgi:GNAT superfamily N-acetyltransferase